MAHTWDYWEYLLLNVLTLKVKLSCVVLFSILLYQFVPGEFVYTTAIGQLGGPCMW